MGSSNLMTDPLPFTIQVVLLSALVSAAGFAQTPRSWAKCVGHETPDLVMEGCSEIIEEAQQPPAILALAYNNRGVAYKTKEAYDLALQDYNQAIQLNPSAANHYNNRGIIYRIKHEYDRAIADYDEAIWLKSGYVAAFYNRALAYTDKGDYDRALADFGIVLQFNPKSALALYARGTMLSKKGLEMPILLPRKRSIPTLLRNLMPHPDYPEFVREAASCIKNCEGPVLPSPKRSTSPRVTSTPQSWMV
jgi:tetratricopeptide (TPR) repeat protein